jgi:hypothetical protein
MEQLDLTDFFQTKLGALDFSAKIAAISEDIFKSDFILEKSLMPKLGMQKTELFMQLLRDHNINPESNSDLKNFLNMILETVKALPILSIKIALEPSAEILKAIADWFVINLKKQILLDVGVDQNIIGGAAISYNGGYLDLSVKKKFETLVTEVITSKQAPSSENKPPEATVRHNLEHFSMGR